MSEPIMSKIENEELSWGKDGETGGNRPQHRNNPQGERPIGSVCHLLFKMPEFYRFIQVALATLRQSDSSLTLPISTPTHCFPNLPPAVFIFAGSPLLHLPFTPPLLWSSTSIHLMIPVGLGSPRHTAHARASAYGRSTDGYQRILYISNSRATIYRRT